MPKARTSTSAPATPKDRSSKARKPRRWGLRTLALLGLALLAMLTSEIQGHYTVLSLAGLAVGLIGALICSIRGLANSLRSPGPR